MRMHHPFVSSLFCLLLCASPGVAQEAPLPATVPSDPVTSESGTRDSPDRQPATIGGLAREYILAGPSELRNVIVLASGTYVDRQAKKDFDQEVSQIQADLGPEFSVHSRLMTVSPGDKLFATLNLSHGAEAANADAILKAGDNGAVVAIVLDAAALDECLKALAYTERSRIPVPVKLILAANVSEQALASHGKAAIPIVALAGTDDTGTQ